jgi:hypothetical protein
MTFVSDFVSEEPQAIISFDRLFVQLGPA